MQQEQKITVTVPKSFWDNIPRIIQQNAMLQAEILGMAWAEANASAKVEPVQADAPNK